MSLAVAGTVAWASVEEAACCLADSTCQILHHNDCVDLGGEPYPIGSTCGSVTCSSVAWLQPPRMVEEKPLIGCLDDWEETSIRLGSQIAADDFVLAETAPIEEIHWWGAYRDWLHEFPPSDAANFFHLAIWTHVDPDPGPPIIHFPRPDVVIHEWLVPRSVLSETYTACVLDRSLTHAVGSGFFYRWSVPSEVRFVAQGGVRYWLTISAAMLDPDCDCDSDLTPPFEEYDQADVDFVGEQVGCPVGKGDPDCDTADLNCDGVVNSQDVQIAHCQRVFNSADPSCCIPTPPKSFWGWVTSDYVGDHAGVRIVSPIDPTVGSAFGGGTLVESSSGVRKELAFVLFTSEASPEPDPPTSLPTGPVCSPESDHGNPYGLPVRELNRPSCLPEAE